MPSTISRTYTIEDETFAEAKARHASYAKSSGYENTDTMTVAFIISEMTSSLDLCGTGTLMGIQSETGKAVVIPLTCKSWACDRCRPRKARQWKAIAELGKPERFITLTCAPEQYKTPAHAMLKMTKAWTKLVEEIRKEWGEMEFIKVWELTKDGWPHLHILQRGCWIRQKWLSEHWQKLGGGKIVDIRTVKNAKIAVKYIIKYLGKGFGVMCKQWPNKRLISKSRGWVLPVEDEPQPEPRIQYTWYRLKEHIADILKDLARCGVQELEYEDWKVEARFSLRHARMPNDLECEDLRDILESYLIPSINPMNSEEWFL